MTARFAWIADKVEKIACAKGCGWKTKGGLTAERTAASAVRHARVCKGPVYKIA